MPTFGQKQICLWNAITHNWRIWCIRTKVSRGGYALRWRHNGRDSVSHHQPHDCLLNRLFRHRSKKTSKPHVTGLCAGNSPGPVNFPHKWPVTRKMFPFDDVIMECRNWIGLVYTTNHTNYMHTARNLVFDQQHFICPICGNLYRKLSHMYMVLIDTDVMEVMWWTIRIYHVIHDDVIKWQHFPRYWPFVLGIHRSPVISPHKRQWRGALMFFFYLRPNKRLSKQSRGWWFETLPCPLWRRCNALWELERASKNETGRLDDLSTSLKYG